ncbi:auxin canalization protein [Trifolium repens]|nr:auxin canalization protein [Trifolium repens]
MTLTAAAAATENFLDICSRELLATGCELLELTRKGDLHWKVFCRMNCLQSYDLEQKELFKEERDDEL